MKKQLFFLPVLFLIMSCATKPPYKENVLFLDYSYFQQNNFFVTESDAVSFNYDAVGSMHVIINSGYEVLNQKIVGKNDSNDDMYKNEGGTRTKYGKFKVPKVEDAFKLLYEEATKVGANGILNLKIEHVIGELTVSGMLIRF